jgi:hypothetical protein
MRLCTVALVIFATAAHAEEPQAAPSEEEGWSGFAQFGAGYDTNANGSPRERNFLGFRLDSRYVQSESAFGEFALGANHTALFGAQQGLNSSVQLAHRANPDAPFADQTFASFGAETVLLGMGARARFTAGLSGYSSRLDRSNFERGANFDLGVSYQPGDTFDSELTLRTSRVAYAETVLERLDVDRYLAGLTVTRLNIGAHAGSVGFTLIGGVDASRRAGSPFGNHRLGAQISTHWSLLSQTSLYVEASAMRVDYAGTFFDRERADDQYGAAIVLEFTDWPAMRWSVTPQVRHERIRSSVALFEFERTEAAFYVRRQF